MHQNNYKKISNSISHYALNGVSKTPLTLSNYKKICIQEVTSLKSCCRKANVLHYLESESSIALGMKAQSDKRKKLNNIF